MNLSDLSEFVDISRQKIRKDVIEDFDGIDIEDSKLEEIVEKKVKKEIQDSIQTMNYQWNTMSSANGQTPFISLFMYLDDTENEREKEDTALLIEEVLNQRLKGFKNENGAYVTPTFPKLLLALDENIMNEDSKYHYLLELSAKCTAKRMNPDYISVKKMKELKQGDVYPCMGFKTSMAHVKLGELIFQ